MVWLHNEKEIKPSKDFVYSRSGDRHFLQIPEIFPEDAGTYTCEAFNDVGECFSACTLVVEVSSIRLLQIRRVELVDPGWINGITIG